MTPQEQLDINAAFSAARRGGLFFFQKAGQFLIYRQVKPKNVLVGKAATPAELRRKVFQAATTVASHTLPTNSRQEVSHANV